LNRGAMTSGTGNKMKSHEQLHDLIWRLADEWPELADWDLKISTNPARFQLPWECMVEVEDTGLGSVHFKSKEISFSRGLRHWSDPAAMALILHEFGHVVGGHCAGEKTCLEHHWDEYWADEFAFQGIKDHYGMVPIDAAYWLLKQRELWELDTYTHPAGLRRWQRLVLNGYVPFGHEWQRAELNLPEWKDEGIKHEVTFRNRPGE